MGDEVRRTQRGNNNAYCQDNEISWLDWSLSTGTRICIALYDADRASPAMDGDARRDERD